jgi:hypothetical protein
LELVCQTNAKNILKLISTQSKNLIKIGYNFAENVPAPINGFHQQQSPASSSSITGGLEAETRSLDRHLFGLTWHRASTGKSGDRNKQTANNDKAQHLEGFVS